MSGTGDEPDSMTWRLADSWEPPLDQPAQKESLSRSSAAIAARISWGWGTVVIGVLVAIAIFFGLILAIVGGLALLGIEPDEKSPGGLALNTLLYVSFLGVPWVIASRGGRSAREALGFQGIRWRQLWWVPVGLVMTYAVMIVFVLLQQLVGIEPEGNLDSDLLSDNGTVAVAILAIGVVAPIAEEVFFRGFIFPGITRSAGTIPGLLVSGVLFGSAHLQLSLLIPFSAVGVVFAFLYLRTKSIYTSMLVHGAFNMISLILAISGAGE